MEISGEDDENDRHRPFAPLTGNATRGGIWFLRAIASMYLHEGLYLSRSFETSVKAPCSICVRVAILFGGLVYDLW